jgi:hypothetical protein
MGSAQRSRRALLGGCDCYLLALEDLMVRAGQGRHVGVTVVEVGAGFSEARFRSAVERFAASQPLLGAEVRRGWPGAVPSWRMGADPQIQVAIHAEGTPWQELATERLRGEWSGKMRFDLIPSADGGVLVMMSWSHLVLDARGIELVWAELARLGAASSVLAEEDSRAVPYAGLTRRGISAVRPFLARYWKLREDRVVSAGPPPARAAAPRFEVVRFSTEETAAMKRRAEPVTGGLFALPWFLAVTMRAHAEVFRARGISDGTLECTISVQGRKRGARGPIFQNQVTQLHFALPLDRLATPEAAAGELLAQFADMTREKCDEAFVVMIDWMRRLPPFLYRRFLRREASGQIASFYHAHTGEFLSGVSDFCGGSVLDGWHIPSVPQPPGTGLFFSERAGRLTASLCWREGVLSSEEQRRMLGRLRADLLGAR